MKNVTRRIAAGLALAAAPAMIALGTATMSHADTSVSAGRGAPATSISHPAFPHQTNAPQPGTSVHHHHQNHR
ncbi:hypothetical protein BH09ACT8_BH09ACT8_31390 [soil metagenome]